MNIKSGVTTASYNLTLPTALGSSGQCLSDTTGADVRGWAWCGSGSGGSSNSPITVVNATLWNSYNGTLNATTTTVNDTPVNIGDRGRVAIDPAAGLDL